MNAEHSEFRSVRQLATTILERAKRGTIRLHQADLRLIEQQVTGLGQDQKTTETHDQTAPRIIRDRTTLSTLATELARADMVAIDLETSGLDYRTGEIVGIGLAIDHGTYYIPTGHRLQETNQLVPDQFSTADAAAILNLEQLKLVAHNYKFELRWLRHHTNQGPKFVWDTMIAAKLLHSDMAAGLKEVAMRELDAPDWSLSKVEMERIQFVPVDRVARYCSRDVYYTLELAKRQVACQV